MSSTGSDSNNGLTVNTPYLTFTKACTVLGAGDTLFLLAGTYQSLAGNAASTHFSISNLTGTALNPITIINYQGGLVQFDCSNITPTNANPFAMIVSNCSYVKVKGFRVKNLKQINDGSGVSRGFMFYQTHHCTAELLYVYNIGGTACTIQESDYVTYLNCDASNCGDGRSPDQWNFGDSFTCTADTSNNILFEGCRGWICGDDLWDLFGWQGRHVTIKNCWSFFSSIKPWGLSGTQPDEANMTPPDPTLWASNNNWRTSLTSGEGFKLGGCNFSPPTCQTGGINELRKILINCVSVGNSGTGYASNSTNGPQYSHIMSFTNSISYGNGNDGWSFTADRTAGIKDVFHNNWAWNNNLLQTGGDFAYGGSCDSVSNNVWMTTYDLNCGNLKPPLSVSAADFLSINQAELALPRKADGSLPDINFLHLVAGSDLRNVGLPTSLITYCDPLPDLGAFQYCSTTFPTVNIGADKVITLPTNTVSFTPTVTNATSYLWSTYSGSAGTFSNPTSANTSYGNLNTAGVRGVRLCVTNSSGTVCDSALVTVNTGATAPTCSAGTTPVSITLPVQTVALSGTGASTSGNSVSFLWGFTLGSGTIANNTAQNTTATMTTANSYTVSLLVTDLGNGLTCTSSKSITVNPALVVPTANAGANQNITLPTSSVSLSGSGSGGTINSYLWTKLSGVGGTFSAATSANTNFSGLVAGTYLIQLRVGNTDGNFGYDSLTVTVNPAPVAPSCNAGTTPVTIVLPTNSVGLSATGSGVNPVSFAWTQVSGTAATIVNPNSQNATATNLVAGTCVFRVTVTDNVNALTCTSNKTVTINNASPVVPPVVNAGADQNIALPNTSTTLTGSAIPGTGVITTYLWQKLAGSPTGGAITSSSSATTTITALIAGTYRYSLTATQTGGLSAADTVVITVSSSASGNGIKYFQTSIYHNTDVNLGFTFYPEQNPTTKYLIGQIKNSSGVFVDFGARIIPVNGVIDYWSFYSLVGKPKGNYDFRVMQKDESFTYYSIVKTVKKK